MPTVALSSSDMVFYYQLVSSDGETLDPQKPNLLFLHPGTTDSTYFSAQLEDPRFKRAYNLIAFDARAHGKTVGTPILDVTLDRKARCLLEAWKKLGFGPFHVYGESFCGTNIGMYLAVLRPDLVQSLILASPMYGTEQGGNLQIYQRAMNEMLRNKGSNGDGSGCFPRDVLRDVVNLWQGDHVNEVNKLKWANKFLLRYGAGHSEEEVVELLYPLLNRHPINDALLEQITCPVLILRGTDDRAAGPSEAEALASKLVSVPGGAPEFFLLQGAPHHASLSCPGIISRFILSFLSKVTEAQARKQQGKKKYLGFSF